MFDVNNFSGVLNVLFPRCVAHNIYSKIPKISPSMYKPLQNNIGPPKS